MKKTILLFAISYCLHFNSSFFAQDKDLLESIEDSTKTTEVVKNAFKSIRIINAHSMEFLAPQNMDFRILHRFGLMSNGTNNLFGLDEASMRIGFDFGITRNFQLGFGRSTFKKELDGYCKVAIVRQTIGSKSFPATIALVVGTTINTLPFSSTAAHTNFTARLAYYVQTIVGRKLNENFTLQVTPTFVHSNVVDITKQNDVFATGFGGRAKLTKRTSLTWDYFYLFNGRTDKINYHPLSLGVDIETGGHVFQLHISNAVGMNERAFITETTDNFSKGEIRFGFNLSRMFQLKKRNIE